MKGLKGDVSGSQVKIASSSGTEDVLVIDTTGVVEELSFSGEFKSNGSKKVHLVKRGDGTQILATSSLDTASTTVEGGTLRFTASGKTWSNFTVQNGAEAVFELDWKFDPTSSVITVNGGSLTVEGTVGGVNSAGGKPDAGTFKLGTVDGDVTSMLTIGGAAKIKSLEMYRGSTANFKNNLTITGGDMTVAGGTLTVTGALAAGEHNLNISGGEVTLNGRLTAGAVNVSGGENSSLNINNGGTLTSLVLSDGAEVTLGGGVLSMSSVSLASGTATLTLNVTGSGQPKLRIGAANIGGSPSEVSMLSLADGTALVIKVNLAEEYEVGKDGYNPFEGTLGSEIIQALSDQDIVWKFAVADQEVEGTYEVLIDEEGNAAVKKISDVDLTWTATDEKTELVWNTTDTPWDIGTHVHFQNGNDVTLKSSAGVTAATVTVADGIVAGAVSVGAEEPVVTTTWTFEIGGTFTATNLTVAAGDTVTMEAALGGTGASRTVELGGLTLEAGSTFNTQSGGYGPFDSFTVKGTISGQGDGDTRSAVTFNNTNVVFGQGLVIDGANVTLTGKNSSLEGAGTGGLTLQNGATLTVDLLDESSQYDVKFNLGVIGVQENSTLVIKDSGDWTGTTVQGDGTMRWEGLGLIGSGSGARLAYQLLQGETLGRLELAGTQLHATSSNAGNLAMVKTVALTDAASTFTVDDNLAKNVDGTTINTLEVTTAGRADAAIIWSTGTIDLAWDISADGDLSVQAAGTGSSFSGTLTGTAEGGARQTLTITGGALTLKSGFAIGSGTWTIATGDGAGLTLDTTLGEGALQNATVNLGTNGTLTLQGTTATVGTLNGAGSVSGESSTLTVNGGTFNGAVTLGGLTLGGESFSLTATEGSSVTTLNVDTHTLTLGGELSVQNLAGNGSITAAPEGGATLKIDGNSWSGSKIFNGTVSTNLEFTSNSRTNSLTIAKFSDGSVTVNGGTLIILDGTDATTGTLTLVGSDTHVAHGATLTLGGSEGASNVTIDGDIALSGTLNLTGASGNKEITGTLNLDNNEASVDWEGTLKVGRLAGEARTALTPGHGASLTLTGTDTDFAGDIDLVGGTLSTTNSAEDPAAMNTTTLSGHVSAGSVNVGANTTLNLGENYTLTGDSNTVDGTLNVTGGTLQGVRGSGTVSTTGEMTAFTTAADGFKGTLELMGDGAVTAEENLTLGALTGDGALILRDTKTLTLTGAAGTSEFSGTLSGTGADLSYSGENGQTQSFTRSTNWDNLTLTGEGTLSLNGGTVQTLAGTSTGKLTVGEAGLEIGEWASDASLSSLTLNGNLAVGRGVVDVRAVTGSGKLLMDLSDEPGVTFAQTMANMTGGLTIGLSGIEEILKKPDRSYALFGDAYEGGLITAELTFELSDEGYDDWKATFDPNTGRIQFSLAEGVELEWNGSSSFTWDSANTGTVDGWNVKYAPFSETQDVALKGTGDGEVTVTLSGDVPVRDLIIGTDGGQHDPE